MLKSAAKWLLVIPVAVALFVVAFLLGRKRLADRTITLEVENGTDSGDNLNA